MHAEDLEIVIRSHLGMAWLFEVHINAVLGIVPCERRWGRCSLVQVPLEPPVERRPFLNQVSLLNQISLPNQIRKVVKYGIVRMKLHVWGKVMLHERKCFFTAALTHMWGYRQ